MPKNLFKIFSIVFISILIFITCSREEFNNPFNPVKTASILSPEVKSRLVNGTATTEDIQNLINLYRDYQAGTKKSKKENPDAVISMPETGKLLVTLRDNDAGWCSELYMKVDDEITLLFKDTREGPLNVTTEYAYAAGTQIEFFLVTYTPWGEVWTNNANSDYCKVEYYEDEMKWILRFEDDLTKNSDMDFNDCVVEVQLAPDPFVDLSDCFDISVEYLNHHGYTPEGYVIYYIGETMHYKVNINVVKDSSLFKDKAYTVYAIQEYYEDTTCNRWWYPSPPRPADEPQEITVKKGDPLPNQDPPQSWNNVTFSYPGSVSLEGSYTSTLAVAAGNDQTHVLIVRENEDGEIELCIYDNPEAGVFDPPPAL